MASTDPTPALAERIGAHCSRHADGRVEIHSVRPLAGGACQDNFAVELSIVGGLQHGAHRLVLRSDSSHLLDGTLDRAAEFEVIGAAVSVGVQTPPARWPGRDVIKPGATCFLLDWAQGDAIGRKIVSDPKLAAARRALPRQLATELARLHTVTPQTHTLPLLPPPPADPEAAALEGCRRMMDGLPEPHPAQELIVRWLETHRSGDDEVCLVHRDFRTGNFLVTPEGLSAVLDWEFAGWGSPVEDLAWIAVRDWRFGLLDRPIGGFAQRDDFYAAYEAASGRAVDRGRCHWWEVMGNLRWALGSVRQGLRYTSGEDRDLELIAIARRAAEMEFEALRLMERGTF